jgi:hypothetical protein
MKVIVRENRIVSLDAPTLLILLNEEEIVDVPTVVRVGWYRDGGNWIPPHQKGVTDDTN